MNHAFVCTILRSALMTASQCVALFAEGQPSAAGPRVVCEDTVLMTVTASVEKASD